MDGRQSYGGKGIKMIELHFIKRSSLRKVFIKDREITMITPELNYQPMKITITQLKTALASGDERINRALKDTETNLDEYNDDESIMKDILKDFQESGWRCIKRICPQ
jgi:hypothetical protein